MRKKVVNALFMFVAMSFIATNAVSAIEKATPIYGADDIYVGDTRTFSGLDGLPLVQDYLEYNSFNRFKDSLSWCKQLGWLRGDIMDLVNLAACEDQKYQDEREFVAIRKVGKLVGGSLEKGQNSKFYHDLNNTELSEGDVVEAMMLIHNNAVTITNLSNPSQRDIVQNTAKNVISRITVNGNQVEASITASNSFRDKPDSSVFADYQKGIESKNVATFEDQASIPEGLKLDFLESEKGGVRGVIVCSEGDHSFCTSSGGAYILGNPILQSTTRVTLTDNTLSYTLPEQVGSQEYVSYIRVYLKVSKDTSTTPIQASRLGVCTSNDTYKVEFKWNEPATKIEITDTDDGTIYEKTFASTTRTTTGPDGFNLDQFYVGTNYKWRLLTESGWKQGNDINFDCDDYDNGFRITDRECIDDALYIVKANWSFTNPDAKIQISTDKRFTTSKEKFVGNVNNTLLPEGISGLKLESNKRYYWRVWDGTKWVRGKSFSFVCGGDDSGYNVTKVACSTNGTGYTAKFEWDFVSDAAKIQVSTNQLWIASNTMSLNVPGVRSVTGPDGFTNAPSSGFAPYTTYYWRVYNGTEWVNGGAFNFNCDETGNLCGNLLPDEGEECDDGGYTGVNDACTADCKIIPLECNSGSCACVEMEVAPGVAGDFNKATYVVEVENRTKNETVARQIILRNVKVDGTKGVTRILRQDNTGQYKSDTLSGADAQGAFIVTDVRAEVMPNTTSGSMRSGRPEQASYPIQVSGLEAFKNNQDADITLSNLYQGDKVKIYITGTARTSFPGFEFKQTTTGVGYNIHMSTLSEKGINNGDNKELLISRPFLLTFNDGDVLTSAVVTGLANLIQVARDVSGTNWQGNYSGYFLEQAKRVIVGANNVSSDDTKLSINIDADKLASGVNKTIQKFDGGNTIGSNASSVILRSENDLERANTGLTRRPDGSRIYLAKGSAGTNQRVEIGTLGSNVQMNLSEQSTIIVENRDLYIYSDIVYNTSNAKTPSIAFVVKGGNIYIHPSVKKLDGVFIALDDTGKISGTPDWKQYYINGNTPVSLAVRGSLYGDLSGLFDSRPNVLDPTDSSVALADSAGITVDFDGRLYSATPPGLQEIVGQVFTKLR